MKAADNHRPTNKMTEPILQDESDPPVVLRNQSPSFGLQTLFGADNRHDDHRRIGGLKDEAARKLFDSPVAQCGVLVAAVDLTQGVSVDKDFLVTEHRAGKAVTLFATKPCNEAEHNPAVSTFHDESSLSQLDAEIASTSGNS